MTHSSARSPVQREGLWLPALVLSIGLVLAGLLMAGAVRDFRLADRMVEVKGLAEREVAADLAIWPVAYTLAAESLEGLQAALGSADEAVIAYLKLHGFDDDEITRAPPRINDQWVHVWGENRPAQRYTGERTLTLKTRKVEAAHRALQNAADLLGQGVLLAPAWGSSAQFLFTDLESIKPDMIAEATADARRAAAQFAEDSGSRVGSIKRARQGFFSITEQDPSTPEIKIVRVVTTVEYSLE